MSRRRVGINIPVDVMWYLRTDTSLNPAAIAGTGRRTRSCSMEQRRIAITRSNLLRFSSSSVAEAALALATPAQPRLRCAGQSETASPSPAEVVETAQPKLADISARPEVIQCRSLRSKDASAQPGSGELDPAEMKSSAQPK